MTTTFTLSYEGSIADDHEIDLYDVSRALVGFQRSLALTTHLVINNEIITQSPALKGARILSSPPQEGSWEIVAAVVTGAYALGVAPKDSVIGHLVRSAYDYVIHETLGFRVDFEQSLGQQYDELTNAEKEEVPVLSQSRFDSLLEKCEPAIKDMHRPIVGSETAESARIYSGDEKYEEPFDVRLTARTYAQISEIRISERPQRYTGRVTSFNSNTYMGRIYVRELGRPIPFELKGTARSLGIKRIIANSLSVNVEDDRYSNLGIGFIVFDAFTHLSRTEQVKSFDIIHVHP